MHAAHPSNVECLRYLVALCRELGREQEAAKWAQALQRAERQAVRRFGGGGSELAVQATA